MKISEIWKFRNDFNKIFPNIKLQQPKDLINAVNYLVDNPSVLLNLSYSEDEVKSISVYKGSEQLKRTVLQKIYSENPDWIILNDTYYNAYLETLDLSFEPFEVYKNMLPIVGYKIRPTNMSKHEAWDEWVFAFYDAATQEQLDKYAPKHVSDYLTTNV